MYPHIKGRESRRGATRIFPLREAFNALQRRAETMQATGVLGEHDMECTDAGTYSSIVCHYCIDVPKLVCESICASGLDQTPSNCNWSPWWAWHGLSVGEGWCCGGY